MRIIDESKKLRFKFKVNNGLKRVIAAWVTLEQCLAGENEKKLTLFNDTCEHFTFEVIPIDVYASAVTHNMTGSIAKIHYKGEDDGGMVIQVDHVTLAGDDVEILGYEEDTTIIPDMPVCTCDISIGGCNCDAGKAELAAERKIKGISTAYRS